MSALLVAIDVLSTRISLFLKLEKKWLSYEPKPYAQIWAWPPNFTVFGQISVFLNEATFLRHVGLKYTVHLSVNF